MDCSNSAIQHYISPWSTCICIRSLGFRNVRKPIVAPPISRCVESGERIVLNA